MLESETFKRSPKISRLLSYLCEKYFQGNASGIKEYSIAVDALGRDARFDPQQDAIVRVETYHLRKRLKQYYASEGRDSRLQIVLPAGQYQPTFVAKPVSPANDPSALDGNKKTAGFRRKGVALGLGLVVVTFCLLTLARRTLGRTDAAAKAPEVAAVGIDNRPAIRILAGDRSVPYLDRAGRTWLTDRYFHGGTTFHRGPIPIRRTEDPEIYQTGREGNFMYDVPLSSGVYELHLYFAETGRVGEGLRGINLAMNGTPLPAALDVASDAGEINTATMKIYKDISPAADGLLHLTFQGSDSDPSFLNALEVLPSAPGKMLPVRLTTRNTAYLDHNGQIWLPDNYFVGGRRSTRVVALGPTKDPQLYETQRFGHFTYSIPVIEHERYAITLHFIENYFGQHNVGGPGSRVFDVYCNGATLLKDFDILKETGGGAGPVIKVFHDIPASPQGKLDLTFVPIANFATVSAVEVTED